MQQLGWHQSSFPSIHVVCLFVDNNIKWGGDMFAVGKCQGRRVRAGWERRTDYDTSGLKPPWPFFHPAEEILKWWCATLDTLPSAFKPPWPFSALQGALIVMVCYYRHTYPSGFKPPWAVFHPAEEAFRSKNQRVLAEITNPVQECLKIMSKEISTTA